MEAVFEFLLDVVVGFGFEDAVVSIGVEMYDVVGLEEAGEVLEAVGVAA